MKLSVFNGSPRGNKSNSNVMIQWILTGYGEDVEINYLNKVSKTPIHLDRFIESDKVLMVLPLYTDTMPGIVMHFFEALDSMKERIKGKEIYFVIHSGFPEASQSLGLKKILGRISSRLDLVVKDTYIMGGSEGTRLMPEKIQKKRIRVFNEIGEAIRDNKTLSTNAKDYLQKPLNLSSSRKLLFSLFKKLGLTNLYWNKQLKDNGVYNERFARPYIQEKL